MTNFGYGIKFRILRHIRDGCVCKLGDLSPFQNIELIISWLLIYSSRFRNSSRLSVCG